MRETRQDREIWPKHRGVISSSISASYVCIELIDDAYVKVLKTTIKECMAG